MVKVKICGITNQEDAQLAVQCGADALGFVFYSGSPRCVQVETAAEIIRGLPPFVASVGLFVNERPEQVRAVAEACALDLVQLHGDESQEQCRVPGRRVIKALRVRDAESLELAAAYPDMALLLDTWNPDSYGGTGMTFNWALAASLARKRAVILAGGLTPENVADAVRVVHPWAVDVSSGVERSPGLKDAAKVSAFIRAARGGR